MWGKRVQSEVSNLGDDVEVISLTGRERESHRERIEVFFLGGGTHYGEQGHLCSSRVPCSYGFLREP